REGTVMGCWKSGGEVAGVEESGLMEFGRKPGYRVTMFQNRGDREEYVWGIFISGP
nr:hypothetical protein [Tanacetum cinerariifolium]